MSAVSENDVPKVSAIGFDIGGTKIAYGVIGIDGAPLQAPTVLPTPTDAVEMMRTLGETVNTLRARYLGLAAVGVGAAGLIEWPAGRIVWAPNIRYENMPLKNMLEQACGLPTVVENDANAAAWAEAQLTPSPEYMMFLTVGTGVGGGLILGGELYRGSNGRGSEVGHIIVDPSGDVACGCGNVGCLEAVASGTALGRYGKEAAANYPEGLIAELAGDPSCVTGEIVTAAAIKGDALAQALVARVGWWLGVGLASLVNVLDIQKVVVGGGVAAAGELLLKPARESLARYLFARNYRQEPAVTLARTGSDAGWIGAALLALVSRV